LFTLALAACSHDAPPAQAPADKPVVQQPSPTGTPIAFLIDGAGELHLRDEQVFKLRDIDQSLAGELQALDAKERVANKKRDQGSDAQPTGFAMRGGMGRRGSRQPMPGQGSASHAGAAATTIADQREEKVADALHRALELLDPDQREPAKKILSDHEIDLDEP
jgi:hypothetical protein